MHDEPRDARQPDHGSISATLTAMLIAFVCVLIFRAFVVEAFIIPTGSMAPTLLGRHARLHSPQTGAVWSVGASPRAGATFRADADDPFASLRTIDEEAPVLSGDRIFVFKPLSILGAPARWSVVVFKNPENPGENYIKRLIGLPGEQVWLVDGDVFTRDSDKQPWRIARKPPRVQRALWWPIYSSEHAPLDAHDPALRWRSPWLLTQGDARLDTTGRSFRVDAPSRATLRWDNAVRRVDDATPYNDTPSLRGVPVFPAGDVRFRATLRPDDDALSLSVVLAARSHEFLVELTPTSARLSSRRAQGDAASERWTVHDERPFAGFGASRWHSVSVEHLDQAIEARVDGRTVFRHELDWSPSERLRNATGMTQEELDNALRDAHSRALADPFTYRMSEARVRATLEGSPVTLARVGLDRDVSYQPAYREAGRFSGEMALASHPLRAARLTRQQLFVLGDNAAASRDGRVWDSVDTRVAQQVDPAVGVVPRSLVSGRAFMVYFPAPHALRIAGERRPLVPDAGRVRFIR